MWQGWLRAVIQRRVNARVNDLARGGGGGGLQVVVAVWVAYGQISLCHGAYGAVGEALWWGKAMFQLAWLFTGFSGLVLHGFLGFIGD